MDEKFSKYRKNLLKKVMILLREHGAGKNASALRRAEVKKAYFIKLSFIDFVNAPLSF
jgi:hypothetical protein